MVLSPVEDRFSFFETALFVPELRTLVVSDLQLGQEGQLRSHGQNIPYQDAQRISDSLERLIRQTRAARLVIAGDLKHEFGRINAQERHETLRILGALKRRVEIILVRGNHDTITKPLADELGVPFVDTWSAADVLVIHGHKLPDLDDAAVKRAKIVIIGHLHPAITLSDGVRAEKLKCFLVGHWRRKQLVVLPSTSGLDPGHDVLRGSSNSPLLGSASLARCVVHAITDDGITEFGTVAHLRRVLERLGR